MVVRDGRRAIRDRHALAVLITVAMELFCRVFNDIP